MPVSQELLDILVCPVSRTRLVRMESEPTRALLEGLASGPFEAGKDWEPARISEVLRTEDGRRAYPVVDGIPVLLAEAGVVLDPGGEG